MIKAIVADDEPKVRSAILRQGAWEALGIEVAAQAADGDELCALVACHHPAVVITDMRMPGRSGAELIRALAESRPPMQLVVVSGYSDFEYMKQAVRSGVVEYILKPIDEAELNGALARAAENARRQEEARKKEQKGARTLALARESTLNRFVSGVNVSHAEVLAALGLAAGDETRAFRVGVLLLRDFESACARTFQGDVELLLYAVLNVFNELAEGCGQAVRLAGADRLLAVLWPAGEEGALRAKAQDWCAQLEGLLSLKAQLALSGEHRGLGAVPGAFCEAQRAAEALVLQTRESVGFYESGDLAARAYEYIRQNFAGRLTAEDLARRFYVSPQYLARVFRARFSMSPYECVTQMKVERAGEMLASGRYKAREIVEELGFLDESHFSKTFKKHTGQSPRAYQKAHRP